MSDTTIKTLAAAVDEAIGRLETTFDAYAAAANAANAEHIITCNQPHPRLEAPGAHVLAALASRPRLATALSLSPVNPPISVAARHE